MGVYVTYTPRLPSEYQEVEYIQSTGNQYIDTGYNYNGTYFRIDFQLMFNSYSYGGTGANVPFICGVIGRSSGNMFMSVGANDRVFGIATGTEMATSLPVQLGVKYDTMLEYKSGTMTFKSNGSTVTTSSTGTFYTGKSIPIFCRWDIQYSGLYSYFCTDMRMYGCQIYSAENTLARNFVPCYRKSDNVIGMYDLVNNQFYTNSGTGTFSKGNDVTMVEMKNAYIGEVWTPGSNTIAYWELNGNGDDTKNSYGIQTYTTTNYNSNGYVGAGNPTYTTTRNGKPCAYFDGTRALKFPTTIPIPSNTLTFSAWVKISANPSSAASIFQLREDISGNTSSTAFEFLVQNGKLLPQWIATTSSTGKTGQTAYTTTGITYTLDTRYNIVVTFNAGTLKFYVNGNLVDTATGNAWLRNNGETSSYIGGQYKSGWSVASYINGYVQDVIYENSVWSDTDVLNYYNKTK